MASVDTAQRPSRSRGGEELLFSAWRLLASAQFAIALIGFLAIAGVIAVAVPQIPAAIRGNGAAVNVWLELRQDSFGPLTEPLYRVGVFSVAATWWFLAGLVLLAVSVGVYTLDRFLDIWRNVTQPRQQVPDSFFERAANRAALDTPASPADGASQIEAILSKRRFRVRRVEEGATTYLFADRFAWAQLGNFATHIALVLFLVGGLLSQRGGFTSALLIAEGTTNPVFPISHPEQMQVEVLDAVGLFDERGIPLDYRSQLVIYQGGEEVARGTATVNGPLRYGGYRFHQAGYFGEGAALRVLDAATGNTVYTEVLKLTELSPAPAVVVRDAQGAVLLDDVIVPSDFIEDARGELITVPGSGREFWVGLMQDSAGVDASWNLVVYDRDESGARFVLPEGETRREDGLEWTFAAAAGLPSILAPGLPGDSERTLTVLSETPDGTPFLTVLGAVEGRALTLFPDRPVEINGLEYRFEGRREFAGIEVRRDPGANFIWVAAGLLLAGLMVTFYLPRLRLWARVRAGETVVASLAERRGIFQAEADHLRKELKAARIDGKREGDVND